MPAEEKQMVDQTPVREKPQIWLYLAGVFFLVLSVIIGVVIYYLFFGPSTEPESTPGLIEETAKIVPRLPKPIEEDEAAEKRTELGRDLEDLEGELNTLDQIDKELNSPEVDLDLGL